MVFALLLCHRSVSNFFLSLSLSPLFAYLQAAADRHGAFVRSHFKYIFAYVCVFLFVLLTYTFCRFLCLCFLFFCFALYRTIQIEVYLDIQNYVQILSLFLLLRCPSRLLQHICFVVSVVFLLNISGGIFPQMIYICFRSFNFCYGVILVFVILTVANLFAIFSKRSCVRQVSESVIFLSFASSKEQCVSSLL